MFWWKHSICLSIAGVVSLNSTSFIIWLIKRPFFKMFCYFFLWCMIFFLRVSSVSQPLHLWGVWFRLSILCQNCTRKWWLAFFNLFFTLIRYSLWLSSILSWTDCICSRHLPLRLWYMVEWLAGLLLVFFFSSNHIFLSIVTVLIAQRNQYIMIAKQKNQTNIKFRRARKNYLSTMSVLYFTMHWKLMLITIYFKTLSTLFILLKKLFYSCQI